MLKYSFIIPFYNAEKTIGNTINSIFESGIKDFEIIVVDDGSSDYSSSICTSIIEQYNNIRYFKQENNGVSVARNYGINNAKGEYISFVDADDLLKPFDIDFLNEIYYQQIDMVMWGIESIKIWKKKIVKTDFLTVDYHGIMETSEIPTQFSILYDNNYLAPVWNKFIRRDIVIQNNIFFDGELTNYEDLEYTLRVLKHCNRIYVTNKIYYTYINQYGKDRTGSRIAAIDDIMSNTDIIAKSFFDLDMAIYNTYGKRIDGLNKIVLQIYGEIFRFKLYSMKYRQIESYCNQFVSDYYVRKSKDALLDEQITPFIRKILDRKINGLYWHGIYSQNRHRFANQVKLIIYLLRGTVK